MLASMQALTYVYLSVYEIPRLRAKLLIKKRLCLARFRKQLDGVSENCDMSGIGGNATRRDRFSLDEGWQPLSGWGAWP